MCSLLRVRVVTVASGTVSSARHAATDIALVSSLSDDALSLLWERLAPFHDANRQDTTDTGALLTVAEVAGITALSEKTIRRAINRGELAAQKVGGRIRVSRKDLDDWTGRTPAHRLPPRPSTPQAAAR